MGWGESQALGFDCTDLRYPTIPKREAWVFEAETLGSKQEV